MKHPPWVPNESLDAVSSPMVAFGKSVGSSARPLDIKQSANTADDQLNFAQSDGP